jgi:hypothetical protein
VDEIVSVPLPEIKLGAKNAYNSLKDAYDRFNSQNLMI